MCYLEWGIQPWAISCALYCPLISYTILSNPLSVNYQMQLGHSLGLLPNVNMYEQIMYWLPYELKKFLSPVIFPYYFLLLAQRAYLYLIFLFWSIIFAKGTVGHASNVHELHYVSRTFVFNNLPSRVKTSPNPNAKRFFLWRLKPRCGSIDHFKIESSPSYNSILKF